MKNFNFVSIFSILISLSLVINSCSIKDNEKNSTINKKNTFFVKNELPVKPDPEEDIKFIFKSKDVEMDMALERKYPKNSQSEFKDFSIVPSNLEKKVTVLPTKKEILIDYKKTEKAYRDWYRELYKSCRSKLLDAQKDTNKQLKLQYEEKIRLLPKKSKDKEILEEKFEKDKELREKNFKKQLLDLKTSYKSDLKNLKANIKDFYGVNGNKFKTNGLFDGFDIGKALWNNLLNITPVGLAWSLYNSVSTLSSYVSGNPEPVETTISKLTLGGFPPAPAPISSNSTSSQQTPTIPKGQQTVPDYLSVQTGATTEDSAIDNPNNQINQARTTVKTSTGLGDKLTETVKTIDTTKVNAEVLTKLLSLIDKKKLGSDLLFFLTDAKILNLLGVALNNDSNPKCKAFVTSVNEVESILTNYLKSGVLDPQYNTGCTYGMVLINLAKSRIDINSSYTDKINVSFVINSDYINLENMFLRVLETYNDGALNTDENRIKASAMASHKVLSLKIQTPKLCSQDVTLKINQGNKLATSIAEVPAKSLLFDGEYEINFGLQDTATNQTFYSYNDPIKVNLAKELRKDIGHINENKPILDNNGHPQTPLRMYDLEKVSTKPSTHLNASPYNFSIYIENDTANLFDININRVWNKNYPTIDDSCLKAPVYTGSCLDMTKAQFAVNPARFETGIYEASVKYSGIVSGNNPIDKNGCNDLYPSILNDDPIAKSKCEENLNGISERTKNKTHPFVVLHPNYSTFSRVLNWPNDIQIDSQYSNYNGSKALINNFKGFSTWANVDSFSPTEEIPDYNLGSLPTPLLEKPSTSVINSMIQNTEKFNDSHRMLKYLLGDLTKTHGTNNNYDAFDGVTLKSCSQNSFIHVGAVVNLNNDENNLNNALIQGYGSFASSIPMKLEVVNVNNPSNIVASWSFSAPIGRNTVVERYWDGQPHVTDLVDDVFDTLPNYDSGSYKIRVSIDDEKIDLPSLSKFYNNAYVTYPYISDSSTNALVNINYNSLECSSCKAEEKPFIDHIESGLDLLILDMNTVIADSNSFGIAATGTQTPEKIAADKYDVLYRRIKELRDIGKTCDKNKLKIIIEEIKKLSSEILSVDFISSAAWITTVTATSFAVATESTIGVPLEMNIMARGINLGDTEIPNVMQEMLVLMRKTGQSDCKKYGDQTNLAKTRNNMKGTFKSILYLYKDATEGLKNQTINLSTYQDNINTVYDKVYNFRYFTLASSQQDIDKECDDCKAYGNLDSRPNLECRINKLSPSEKNNFAKTIKIRRGILDTENRNLDDKTIGFGEVYDNKFSPLTATIVGISGGDFKSTPQQKTNLIKAIARKLGINPSSLIIGEEATNLKITPVFVSQKIIGGGSTQNDSEIKILETSNDYFKKNGYNQIELDIVSDRVTCIYCQEVLARVRNKEVNNSIVNLGSVTGKPIYLKETIPKIKLALIEDILGITVGTK